MLARKPELNTEPSSATPMAPPSSRVVSLSAEATPCLWAGSVSVIKVVDGVIARPSPRPNSNRPGSTER
uniref:Unannotated protein n=1 Tax=freshwater metagenome TaxID=449393 RepID=A0A6J7Q0T4_9ZZZZ